MTQARSSSVRGSLDASLSVKDLTAHGSFRCKCRRVKFDEQFEAKPATSLPVDRIFLRVMSLRLHFRIILLENNSNQISYRRKL